MKIEIRNRWTNEIIYECEAESLRAAVEECARLGKSLSGSDLRYSDLSGSDLRYSNLSGSDLRGSDLRCSDLRDSDLSGSDLRCSNLRGSDLSGSDLRYSNLSGSKGADYAIAQTRILPEGSIYGYKKVSTPTGAGIVKLLIPESAARSHAFGRKCRCEYAEVVEAPDGAYTDAHGPRTEYRVGEVVKPDEWDVDWTNECSNGIHFFITRLEAEKYQ